MDSVAQAVAVDVPVEAYVTVLPPADPGEVVDHARRLVSAGARGLGLYHLGLASHRGQRLIAEIVSVMHAIR